MAPAYSDWDIYGTTSQDQYQTSIGTPELSLSLLSQSEGGQAAVSGVPLVGTGTMRMRAQSGALQLIPTFPSATATARGLTAGKIRSVVRWDNHGGVARFGLVAMQSVLNLTTGTGSQGNAYVCLFDTASATNVIRLGKMSTMFLGEWNTLMSSAPAQFVSQTARAVEFEWDASSGVNCALVVRTGSALDFSNLTVLLDYIDTSSPLLTSVAEGLFALYVSGNVDVYWDSTTIYARV